MIVRSAGAAGMRRHFIGIREFAAGRVAETNVRDLNAARRNARVGLGEAGLGVLHGCGVHCGCVVDEILVGGGDCWVGD